jgi:hypothetical protein
MYFNVSYVEKKILLQFKSKLTFSATASWIRYDFFFIFPT